MKVKRFKTTVPCIYYMSGKGDPDGVATPHPNNMMIQVAKIPVPSIFGFGSDTAVLYQCVDCKMIKPGMDVDIEEVELNPVDK